MPTCNTCHVCKMVTNDEHVVIKTKYSPVFSPSCKESLIQVIADLRPELYWLIMIIADCVNKGPDLKSEMGLWLSKN